MSPPLLVVRHLTVSYPGDPTPLGVVRDVSFELAEGGTLALVGETGCGKSTIAKSVCGLLSFDGAVVSGEISIEGRNLLEMGIQGGRRISGRVIGVVFQDPRASLNPVLTIGEQIMESLRAHQDISRRRARERAIELLAEVGIPDAEPQMRRYPMELSGGMCQRVGIALAICNQPRLLVADEPTSALDVTIQAQILELLEEMRTRHNLALLLISHDLALVAEFADRVAVMYHGRLVELGTTREVFSRPHHPYTRALLESLPSLGRRRGGQPLSAIPGSPPPIGQELQGCSFAPRCQMAETRCTEELPPPIRLSGTHWAACVMAK